MEIGAGAPVLVNLLLRGSYMLRCQDNTVAVELGSRKVYLRRAISANSFVKGHTRWFLLIFGLASDHDGDVVSARHWHFVVN